MMRDRTHAPGAGTDRWTGLLSAYLDGDLSPADRLGIEDHLAACPQCAGALADLRLLIDQAALLKAEEEPASDLWPGIRERLRPRRRRWGWPRSVTGPGQEHVLASWGPALAAAAVALLVVAASLLVLWRGNLAPPREDQASSGGAIPVAPLEAPPVDAPAEHVDAPAEYYDTLAGLWREVRENLTHDPRVVEVLEQNLEVIDVAIAEYGDALAEHPGDARLAGRLEEARQRKIEVLRQAADLSTEAGN